jgi:pimeloyl-ACP methyl ester carboxylesterase
MDGPGEAGAKNYPCDGYVHSKPKNSRAALQWCVAVAIFLGPSCAAVGAADRASTRGTDLARPEIVLVHGAFADATGWQKVIQILQRDRYEVTAVENPLESLAGDVATTTRVVEAQQRRVVLVGHSYGGAVITGAAAGNAKVKALV